jgi:type IV pilus assembly protein PilM
LMQTILSALPNEKNNPEPEQADLYRAFAAGDVEKVTKIKRDQRKQIFITGMSIRFVEDLSTASFNDQTTGARLTTYAVSTVHIDPRSMDPRNMDPRANAATAQQRAIMGGAQQAVQQPTEETAQQPQEGKSKAGFVVIIVGYSPYKDITRLIDPLGVGDDRSRWGFITRLKNIDKISDVNSFVLYDANSTQNFTYKINEVSSAEGVPAGVGVPSQRVIEVKRNTDVSQPLGSRPLSLQGNKITETILIDPMTREIIDKVIKYNDDGSRATDNTGRVAYEVNDHWFEIKVKFLWTKVPPEIAALAQKI